MMKTKDEIMQLSGRDLDAAVMMARNIFYDGNIPHYSTDIAAAWELVEKLIKPDWAWHFESEWVDGKAQWYALYWGEDEDGIQDSSNATGDTLPEAISRAFLLAMAGS